MKTSLLLISALLPVALACDSSETARARDDRKVAAPRLQSTAEKTSTDKPPAPNPSAKPASHPAKPREGRPPRPEYLFL